MSDNPHKINALLANLKSVLATDEGEIHQFIKDHSDGLSFENPEESKPFLEDIYCYIKMNI